MNNKYKFPLLPIVLALFCASCLYTSCENSGVVGLDDDTGPGDVLMTDTITVMASTVYAGPIPTTGTDQALVGSYHDERLGKVLCRSYFSIRPSSSDFALDNEIVFDSLALIIRCSGYYYGDTTTAQQLSVFRLEERIEAEELPPNPEGLPLSYLLGDGQLYSTSHFDYDASDPLASVRVRPRPSTDTLHIRLPDALGKEWMRFSEEGDDRIGSAEEFAAYFNGLVLAGDPDEDAAVIGYRADTSFVRLYYRETGSDGLITGKYTDFVVYQPELQFNEIVADRDGTDLDGLVSGNASGSASAGTLPASATSEEAYLQAGTGVMTRLSFPYLKNFLEDAGDSSLTVHSAQLLVRPVTGTISGETYLPQKLILFYTGENNIPLYPLQNTSTGATQIAVFNYDAEFPDQAWYKFGLTGYFTQLLNDYDGTPAALLLSHAAADLSASVSRLCLGSPAHGKNKLQLVLYYTPGGSGTDQ